MPSRDVLAYLELIVRRTKRALDVVSRMGLDEFLDDPDAMDIAFACHHDIGEAIRQMRSSHPTYAEGIADHRAIVGSRNVMSHQLFSRDFERLWYDLKDGLPVLYEETRQLIDSIRAEREQ